MGDEIHPFNPVYWSMGLKIQLGWLKSLKTQSTKLGMKLAL